MRFKQKKQTRAMSADLLWWTLGITVALTAQAAQAHEGDTVEIVEDDVLVAEEEGNSELFILLLLLGLGALGVAGLDGGGSGGGVTPVNYTPAANDDNVISQSNSNTKIIIPIDALLRNDGDANGDPITLVSVSNPIDGTVTIVGPNVEFTPDNQPVSNGSGSFDYTISDPAGATATAKVMIDIREQFTGVTAASVSVVGTIDSEIIVADFNDLFNVAATGDLTIDVDAQAGDDTIVLMSNAIRINSQGSMYSAGIYVESGAGQDMTWIESNELYGLGTDDSAYIRVNNPSGSDMIVIYNNYLDPNADATIEVIGADDGDERVIIDMNTMGANITDFLIQVDTGGWQDEIRVTNHTVDTGPGGSEKIIVKPGDDRDWVTIEGNTLGDNDGLIEVSSLGTGTDEINIINNGVNPGRIYVDGTGASGNKTIVIKENGLGGGGDIDVVNFTSGARDVVRVYDNTSVGDIAIDTGPGNDRIVSYGNEFTGTQSLTGGTGRDTFVFKPDIDPNNSGTTEITDFTTQSSMTANPDLIDLSAYMITFTDLTIMDDGTDTTVTIDANNTFILLGVNNMSGALGEDDFIF